MLDEQNKFNQLLKSGDSDIVALVCQLVKGAPELLNSEVKEGLIKYPLVLLENGLIELLEGLESLYLGNKKLTTLPKEIGQLRCVKSLNLWNNQLTTLPKEIGQLKNLRVLRLTNNPIPEAEINELKIKMPWCEIKFYPWFKLPT